MGVSLSYYERSQNDGAEGSQARQWAIWVMARGCRVEPSTIDEGCPACRRGRPPRPRRVRRARTRPSTARKWALRDAAPCAAFRAVARSRGFQAVDLFFIRRPPQNGGARRRRQRARAVGYMGYMGHVGEGGGDQTIKLYIAEVVATESGGAASAPMVQLGIVIGGS